MVDMLGKNDHLVLRQNSTKHYPLTKLPVYLSDEDWEKPPAVKGRGRSHHNNLKPENLLDYPKRQVREKRSLKVAIFEVIRKNICYRNCEEALGMLT